MGSFISYLRNIYQLLGSKDKNEDKKETQEETIESPSSESNTVLDKSTANGSEVCYGSRRQNENPTCLSSPIKSIIEKSIREEKNKQISKKKARQIKCISGDDNKQEVKNQFKKDSQYDIVAKIDAFNSIENNQTKNITLQREENSVLESSFLPVKKKGKKYTKPAGNQECIYSISKVHVEQTIKKPKEDSSRSTESDDYKKQPRSTDTSVGSVFNNITNYSDKQQIFGESSELEFHLDTPKISNRKKCKKVISTISYVGVVTNTLPDEFTSDKQTNEESLIEVSKDETPVLCLEKQQEIEKYAHLNFYSNSSSIEIITDTSSKHSDIIISQETPSQFEYFSENLNHITLGQVSGLNLEQSDGKYSSDCTHIEHIDHSNYSEKHESSKSPKENIEIEWNTTQCLDRVSIEVTNLSQNQSTKQFHCNELNSDATDLNVEKYAQKFAFATSMNTDTNNRQGGKIDLAKMQQIRILTLNDQEHQECTLFRLKKNWIIQFRLGPSLFGQKVNLYCNYPSGDTGKLEEFDRNKYQLLKWVWDEGCVNADDTAAYSQIKAEHSGSFHYYFVYIDGENHDSQGSGYFLVDPVLMYGNNEELLLDCIQCQTVLSKCLSSFSSWEKKLQVSKESGYNMIHFTPIQELGESNSSYSLSEQLKVNPIFKKRNGKLPTIDEIAQFTTKLRSEWKIVSICDIVLNHTANESKWIQVHPEVTYNCVNCPYLRPAYLLDAALHQFSLDVKKGLYEDRGIPPEVNTEEHLNAIRFHFSTSVLEPLNIPQLYICDINKCIMDFLALARSVPPVTPNSRDTPEQLKLVPDPEFKRLSALINMDLALKLYNVYWADTFDADARLKRCAEELKNELESLNQSTIYEVNKNLRVAVENVIASIRYYRIQDGGPRFKEITVNTPLVYRYFTDYGSPKSLKEHEAIMYSEKGCFVMAHNGWTMDSDPLKNFAGHDTKVYIRRELIAWGDSVKLRYGEKPEDCPFLWEHMKTYVEQTVTIFDGIRLDNCHSTPIPVAEYMLDCARRVRPNLYVVAELFTNSDLTDNIFVNRLGITSLIREAMSAWDSHEEGRLVYRYGGLPVGSFYQPSIRPLVPSIAHALFLDQTHDNPSPVEKRSVFDLLPSTALVNMACCASGSNRGYDELVPHHIDVVEEDRQYTEWSEDKKKSSEGNVRFVNGLSALIGAKKAINDLHFILGKEGFQQVYVDQMDSDIVAVTRHCPNTHHSYILVAFTAFCHPNEKAGDFQRDIQPLRFEGLLEEIVLEATLSHIQNYPGGSKFTKWGIFAKDPKWINGLSDYQVSMKEHIQVEESDAVEKVYSGAQNTTQLNFKNFKPGSIIILKVSLAEPMTRAIKTVCKFIDDFSLTKQTELSSIISKLTLLDLNRILYRCDQEERDEGFGFGTYNIPNYGSMVYAGLQGIISLLADIRSSNDLGHPMCLNLRDGNWMIEYTWKRLITDEGTRELGLWIEQNTKCFSGIPRYLVPCYFDVVITGIYVFLIEQCHNLMNSFVKNGSTFVRSLALGSVQCGAYVKSADLPTLSPNMKSPKPPTRKNDNGEDVQACVTLSAGLPHFSVGYTRNWGRDTFIALRGLFILTGRYQEAREHILGYAACLRHGLIPNLLDGGRNSRFNCRDAIWWWLYCIKEYTSEVPDGIDILSDQVSRLFPADDSSAQAPGVADEPLFDVIQEALMVHFQGLVFRERNAGSQIDEHMTDQGFNIQIGIHPETGMVHISNNNYYYRFEKTKNTLLAETDYWASMDFIAMKDEL